MNIAFVTTEFVTEPTFDGGLANYLDKISLALLEEKHNIYIFIASNENQIFSHKNRIIVRVNTQSILHNFLQKKHIIKYFDPLHWIIQSYKLNKAIKYFSKISSFDIVQYSSHTATGFFIPKNINSIVRISSFQPLWNKHYEIKIDKNVEKWEGFLEIQAIKKAKKVFGPSQLLSQELSYISKRDIKIIESPLITLPKKQFDNSFYNEKLYNKKYLLFFGTLGLLKGIKEISEIIYQLLQENSNLYFVFIGKNTIYNNKPIYSLINTNAKEHQNRCIYYESLNREKLFPIIKNSYAVVLPSRIDNFPNTCCEAMSLSKIVIGTRNTSFEQLIKHQGNGFLAHPYNALSLLHVLREVLQLDKESKLNIEQQAYQTVKRLSPKNVALKHEKLYTLLCYKHITTAYENIRQKITQTKKYKHIALFGFNALSKIIYDTYEDDISYIFDNKNYGKNFQKYKIVKIDTSFNLKDTLLIITAINSNAIEQIKLQVTTLFPSIQIIDCK
jgi:glycosyltransferase involved in cell wall biosynthesis